MVTGLELILEPQEVLQIAVYVPIGTVIVEPVAPLLHSTTPFEQPVAIIMAVSLPHTEVLFAKICGIVGVWPPI